MLLNKALFLRIGMCLGALGLGLLGVLVAAPAAAQPAQPAPAPPTLTGTVTLWYAYSAGSGEETALWQVITNTRNANPGLVLSATRIPFDQIFTLYETQVLTGGGPDLLLVPNDDLGSWVRKGIVRNLDPLLQGRLANVYPNAVEGMRVNGPVYGVPVSAQAVALYYNKALLSTPPTTTAGLLATVQSGQRLLQNQNGYHLFGWWGAFGGLLMDAAGRCIADRGGFAEAMQYQLDLKAAGAEFFTDGGAADNAFRSGNAAMIINGPWMLSNYLQALSNNLGVVPMPTGPVNVAQPLNGLNGFFVNPNTGDVTTTVEVALLMTNQAAAQRFTDVGGLVPVRADVTATNPRLNAFAQASANGFPRPQNQPFGNYWGPFGDMVTQVLTGTVTPTVGVQQACAAMNTANGIAPYNHFLFLSWLQR